MDGGVLVCQTCPSLSVGQKLESHFNRQRSNSITVSGSCQLAVASQIPISKHRILTTECSEVCKNIILDM